MLFHSRQCLLEGKSLTVSWSPYSATEGGALPETGDSGKSHHRSGRAELLGRTKG